jgi:hypothetical protein
MLLGGVAGGTGSSSRVGVTKPDSGGANVGGSGEGKGGSVERREANFKKKKIVGKVYLFFFFI